MKDGGSKRSGWGRRRTRYALAAVLALALVLLLATGASAAFALSITGSDAAPYTPEQLAQALVGPGVEIANVTYGGTAAASGSFADGTTVLGFDQGVVLSSGRATNALGPNVWDGKTTENFTVGDADLTALSGFTTYDANVLEFDFVPESDKVYFSYVWGSDEYTEWVNSPYNDVFAFFVNGVNKATVGGQPVSVNTINQNVNTSLWKNNRAWPGPFDTEMDGFTVPLVLQADVIPNEVNHMKLAIADSSDRALDAWVFLKAGSLSVDPPNVDVQKTVDFDGNGTYGELEANKIGSTAHWKVVVKNTGATKLETITLTDTTGFAFPTYSLDPGKSVTIKYDTVPTAPITNTVKVVALDAAGTEVTKSDTATAKTTTPGWVTGNTWFNSPAGSLLGDPNAGRTLFGVNVRQLAVQPFPNGALWVQPHAWGKLWVYNFQTLDIAGDLVTITGSGNLNGVKYDVVFKLLDSTVVGVPDLVRIKITDPDGVLVYDNMRGEPDDALPSGVAMGAIKVVKY